MVDQSGRDLKDENLSDDERRRFIDDRTKRHLNFICNSFNSHECKRDNSDDGDHVP